MKVLEVKSHAKSNSQALDLVLGEDSISPSIPQIMLTIEILQLCKPENVASYSSEIGNGVRSPMGMRLQASAPLER